MIGFLLWLLVIGAIAGFLARAVVPGRDSMSIPGTILLGVVGSYAGGFLGDLLFDRAEGIGLSPAGLIGSVIGAVLVLLVYNRITVGS